MTQKPITDADIDEYNRQIRENKILPEHLRPTSPRGKRPVSVSRQRVKATTSSEASIGDEEDCTTSSMEDTVTRKTSGGSFSFTQLKRSTSPTRKRSDSATIIKARSCPNTPREFDNGNTSEALKLDDESIKKSIGSMLNINKDARKSEKRSQKEKDGGGGNSSNSNTSSSTTTTTTTTTTTINSVLSPVKSLKRHLKHKNYESGDSGGGVGGVNALYIEEQMKLINKKTDSILLLCVHIAKTTNSNTHKKKEKKKIKQLPPPKSSCCCCCCYSNHDNVRELDTENELGTLTSDDDDDDDDDTTGHEKEDSKKKSESNVKKGKWYYPDKSHLTGNNNVSSSSSSTTPQVPKLSLKQPYFPMRSDLENQHEKIERISLDSKPIVTDDDDYYSDNHPINTCILL